MKKIKEYSLEIGGRQLVAEFTDLADQANGSVLVKYGETTVLATAVMSKNKREGIDYFPLVVDYEERFYAAGGILGSRFIRREGRPSDDAVLGGRIVDRTIRPLFNQNTRNEVQVVVTVLSIDADNDPDVPAVIAASLALGTSNIPWGGPVSATRVGLEGPTLDSSKGRSFEINPSYEKRLASNLDLLVCGKDGKVNMIECEAKEVKEGEAEEAMQMALDEIEKIQKWQKKIISEIGKEKMVVEEVPTPENAPELFKQFESDPELYKKQSDWLAVCPEGLTYFEDKVNDYVHNLALRDGKRVDGRGFDEVRPLSAVAGGVSSVLHGSGIFYRGATHVFTALTLGGPREAQLIEGMETKTKKYFFHHYNFPPYSVAETGRMGGMNRRAIGHGALAEKALRATLPPREEFPYTMRLVSEVMASNGSSSMASVCASTLALMDGGVPISRPMAGIAMGILTEGDDNYKILTDIQGPEDHYGDMDFKVAGTREGITAIQMDVKVGGIPLKVLSEALQKAKAAREQILDVIEKAIPAPRAQLAPAAPKIKIIKIDVDKIGTLIGPGGKMINKIIDETGAGIDIEEDGTVYITGKTEQVEAAAKNVESITHVYHAGEKFEGPVVRLMDFGAFVQIGANTDGLVHISEMAPFRVAQVTDVVKEGDIVPVVIKEIDEKGRINLSIKDVDPEFASRKGVKPSTSSYNGDHGRRDDDKQHGRHSKGEDFSRRR